MLNFSTGSKNVISAIKTAEIKRVYTSRAFVGKAGLEEMIEKIEAESVVVVYLEDIKKSITIGDKLYGIIASLFPQYAYDRALKRTEVADIKSPDNPSVVLFTSGSEGTPKRGRFVPRQHSGEQDTDCIPHRLWPNRCRV